ncbi:S24 family peptidase [Spirosoma fluminis]
MIPELYYELQGMEVDNEAVRARVEQLIELKADGLQRVFARMVNIDESVLSKLLKSGGRREFSEVHLRAIERATRARLEWLQWGEEPMQWPVGELPARPPIQHQGQLLRDYMDRHGPLDSELASRMGKSKSTVSKYFDTASFEFNTRDAILSALGASYDEVFGSPEQPQPSRRIRPVEVSEAGFSIVKIPIRARAGLGYVAYFTGPETEREHVTIPPDKLYAGVKPDDHNIVEVNGDSMEPELKAGYEMLAYRLKPGQFPHLNKIVLVDFRDELTIKRLAAIDWVDHTVTLRSDNGGAELRVPMADIRHIWHVYDYWRARL